MAHFDTGGAESLDSVDTELVSCIRPFICLSALTSPL